MRKALFSVLGLVSILILSGCVARTYQVTRDRVDQDLSAGNQGYLMGKAPVQEGKERSATREIRVFELELGKPYQAKPNVAAGESQPVQDIEEPVSMEENVPLVSPEPATDSAVFEKYTVEKNDTLQKISQKFYGTTKNWTKIYKANKDTLKGPNKVYPGQVLNIPSSPKEKTNQ